MSTPLYDELVQAMTDKKAMQDWAEDRMADHAYGGPIETPDPTPPDETEPSK
jgi:hypothetical protein